MSYPFVKAKWYSPGATIEVRALVAHFAQGGNTVHYLQDPRRPNGTPIDVSATFVLEYSGRVVQMVRDGDADHCQHVSTGDWVYPGFLTRANGVAVLGTEVMDHPDHTRVNRYVQAIEIEGFRDKGMNAAQTASLVELVAERRAKYPTIRGLLGHGDIQDKACPGRLIPWELLGGHGLWAPQEEPVGLRFRIVDAQPGRVAVNGAGHSLIRVYDAARTTVPAGEVRQAIAKVALLQPLDASAGDRTNGYLVGKSSAETSNVEAGFLLASDVTFTADPTVDCNVEINLALDHVAGPAAALATAIQEARPR